MSIYYPRCQVQIRVPLLGSPTTRSGQSKERNTHEFSLLVSKVRLERGDPNTADKCSLEIDWSQGGVDPRLLANANVSVYVGDQRSPDQPWVPTAEDYRFSGIVNKVSRRMNTEGFIVTLDCTDYLTLFLAQKPLAADGIPPYTDTLVDAWARICNHVGIYDYDQKKIVSTVEVFRDRLDVRGIDEDIPIGEAMLARVRQSGAGHSQGASAWDVWSDICNSLGLQTFIDRDRCVVTTSREYYWTSANPATFRWGHNISSLTEERDATYINGRGIHLTSFDPINYQTMEAFFPPRDSGVVLDAKRLGAGATGQGIVGVGQYEHMLYPQSVTQETLQAIAGRVWSERSLQELRGELETSEMVIPLRDGSAGVDVLSLRHGDPIGVVFDQDVLDEMRLQETTSARMAYLVEHGYGADQARLLAEDAGVLSRLSPVVVLSSSTFEMADGSFRIGIKYCSRIDPNTGGPLELPASSKPTPVRGASSTSAKAHDEPIRASIDLETDAGRRFRESLTAPPTITWSRPNASARSRSEGGTQFQQVLDRVAYKFASTGVPDVSAVKQISLSGALQLIGIK